MNCETFFKHTIFRSHKFILFDFIPDAKRQKAEKIPNPAVILN